MVATTQRFFMETDSALPLTHDGSTPNQLRELDKPDCITELEAQLADAKQVANDCRIVADNAIAEALGAKNQWQPIETAPKDGTVILVCRNIESGYEKRVCGTDYFKDGSWWLSRAEMQPTHWMPLPTPPIETTKGNHAKQ